METGGFRFLADSAPPVRRFSACPCFTALFRAPRSKNTTENHTPPRRRKRPPFDRAPPVSPPPSNTPPEANAAPIPASRPPPSEAGNRSPVATVCRAAGFRQAVTPEANAATIDRAAGSVRAGFRQAVRQSIRRPCADSGKWTANKNAAPVRPRRRIRRPSATIAGNAA